MISVSNLAALRKNIQKSMGASEANQAAVCDFDYIRKLDVRLIRRSTH
jgi:hypothetical protein